MGRANKSLLQLGHMTKMAAMPRSGKNSLKIFSGTKGHMIQELGMQH